MQTDDDFSDDLKRMIFASLDWIRDNPDGTIGDARLFDAMNAAAEDGATDELRHAVLVNLRQWFPDRVRH